MFLKFLLTKTRNYFKTQKNCGVFFCNRKWRGFFKKRISWFVLPVLCLEGCVCLFLFAADAKNEKRNRNDLSKQSNSRKMISEWERLFKNKILTNFPIPPEKKTPNFFRVTQPEPKRFIVIDWNLVNFIDFFSFASIVVQLRKKNCVDIR